MPEAPISTNLEFEPQVFSKQSHQFWTLLILGWVGYAFFVFLAIIRPQFSDPNFNLQGQLLNLLLESLSGLVLCYMQWRLIRKIVHLPMNITLFWSFFSAFVLGLIYNIIKLSSFKVIVYNQRWNEAWNMLEFGGWFLFSLATMFVWTAIFFIMLYNTKLQKEHEKLLRAQNEAKDAQLQMLRYQLNPHFMFNTMNAISTLIFKEDNDRANEMLDKLCEFMRYSLDQNAKSETSLRREIDLLELYLSIEKVRFGERLKVDIDVSSDTLNAKVPAMLLQPIVENAIKYAIEPKKEPGLIQVNAWLIDNRLVIRISDDGPGKVQNKGLGIGIKNTKERLNNMFSGDFEVSLESNQKQGATVLISFPYMQVH